MRGVAFLGRPRDHLVRVEHHCAQGVADAVGKELVQRVDGAELGVALPHLVSEHLDQTRLFKQLQFALNKIELFKLFIIPDLKHLCIAVAKYDLSAYNLIVFIEEGVKSMMVCAKPLSCHDNMVPH